MANSVCGAGNQNVGSAQITVTGGGEYTIDTQDVWHGFYADNIRDISNDLVFKSGRKRTDITAYVTYDGGGTTKITTTTNHGFITAGDIITITGTTNYNEIYKVEEVIDQNNFTIDKSWDGNDDATGNIIVPDRLEVKVPGKYSVVASITACCGSTGKTMALGLHCSKTLKNQSKVTFLGVSATESVPLVGLCTLALGDQIWFGVKNEDGTQNFNIGEVSLNAIRAT